MPCPDPKGIAYLIAVRSVVVPVTGRFSAPRFRHLSDRMTGLPQPCRARASGIVRPT